MKKPLDITVGSQKIIKCIESCKNADHIYGCLNMINSYYKIIKLSDDIVYTQSYFIKIFLLEQLSKKANELLSDEIKKSEC